MLVCNRLLISNRHKSVRNGLVHFFTWLLLIAAVVLIFELVLILFGVGDIFLPWLSRFFSV